MDKNVNAADNELMINTLEVQ
jgi:hypothetical protein